MSKSLASAGIKLSILTLGSRLLGLVREMTKATFLGTSGLADAFGVAFMIPNLFRRLFAENSISVVVENSEDKAEEEFDAESFMAQLEAEIYAKLGVDADNGEVTVEVYTEEAKAE